MAEQKDFSAVSGHEEPMIGDSTKEDNMANIVLEFTVTNCKFGEGETV